MWRKAMIHLGLGDDADYEEYQSDHGDDRDQQERSHAREPRPGPGSAVRPQMPTSPPSAYSDEPSAIGAVRPISSRGDADPRELSPAVGQMVTPTGHGIRPRPQVVRPIAVTANAKPQIVVVSSFNQAQDVADKYKGSQPVIMNLQGADRELSRRLIDFASGLCYGLGGQMERVSNQVYLLTPSNVEVSADERRRLRERDYDS